ncbi:SEP domain-containing protein [Sporodiniella umbellata]|nr:SEP domain-containing protein [Sporodiniella umbellata]
MSEKQNESIAQFLSVTQATETQAQFFLESSNWDVELALTQYFAAQASSEAEPASAVQNPITSTHKKTAQSSNSKIRTFRDLTNNAEDEGLSDDDERENLYAGGEKSGGQTQEEPVETQKKPTYYTGAGYRLGSEDMPSSIATPTVSQPPAREELEPAIRHLTFWRNGFSVDDGPLYAYTDPANQEMLTAINSGRAPLSLLNVQHGQPVEVRVIKRQDEEYTPPPKAPAKPFEGAGHRLGAVTPTESITAAPTSTPSEKPPSTLTVDSTQPVTSVQIRLGDGSRLIAQLNHTHTVGDIREYIDS